MDVIALGLLVVVVGSLVVSFARRALEAPQSMPCSVALLAFSLLLLAGALILLIRHGASVAFNLVIGIELITAGVVVLLAAKRSAISRHPVPKVLLGLVFAAVAAIVTVGLAASQQSIDSVLASLSSAKAKTNAGFGPHRRPLHCEEPKSCPGPHYVALDSYINNPVVGREQSFLSLTDPADPHHAVSDSLSVERGPEEITLRVYIDNDTYQHLAALSTTDALNTHIRLALPLQPVYGGYPTIYLYAENARPKVIWDTVFLHSKGPIRLSYVPGSAKLRRREGNGQVATSALVGDVSSGTGLALGDWPADFRYSGYVTLKLRARPLPEPVRDPWATRGVGEGHVVYLPPARSGLAAESTRDGVLGEQFRCSKSRCNGPPFPALDAYANQPLLGDEANFVRAAAVGDDSGTGVEHYRSVAVVHPGEEIKVRVTIDNSADPEAIGAPPLGRLIARDIRAHAVVPKVAGRSLAILAAVDGANTQPRTIVDSLPVRSDQDIRLVVQPETLAVLTDSGGRLLPHEFFTSVKGLFEPGNRGIAIARELPPSFSKVLYIEFYVRVEAAG